ncbi:MAG: tetratricopeptide repeat protein [Bacteroidota bacterium]|nr:tetratricopeptide repeat protein [Bacteroidota bacterium]
MNLPGKLLLLILILFTPLTSYSQNQETLEKAKSGDAQAQFELGIVYFEGNDVDKNYEKAMIWFEKSGSQGNANAQNKLGFMYLLGRGVEKDMKLAAFWYRKAAVQGNTTAQIKLGFMYIHGNGVNKDLYKASHWIEKAYKSGDIQAENIWNQYELWNYKK